MIKYPDNSQMVMEMISKFILALDVADADAEVHWNSEAQKVFVDYIVSWPMPDGEGGIYWESDVSSHEELTLDEIATRLQLGVQHGRV